jgi:cell division protein FtsI/penicillin-binding protein 2
VTVAGKTGTAELRNTSGKINDTKGTDAWFVGFAPAMQPQLAVCALYPEAGYGETAAAPAVRKVLMAALGVR